MNPTVNPTRVIFWNEYIHEKKDPAVSAVYPQGIHAQLAAAFAHDSGLICETATLEEKEHGLSVDRLDATDVLVWWGHLAHKQVEDEIVERVRKRVLEGMGLVVLHSGHYSKVFQRLLGTTCSLGWREARKRAGMGMPAGHPIARDLPAYFEMPHEEMYSEPFGIPNAGRISFYFLVPRWRSLSIGLLLAAWRWKDLLFPARSRNLSHIPATRGSASDPKRHRKGDSGSATLD